MSGSESATVLNRRGDRRRFMIAGSAALLPQVPARGQDTPRPGRSVRDEATGLMERLSQYLWRAQAKNGRWSSPNYGVLKSGQAMTPFVLAALINADPSRATSERTTAAVKWMLRHLRDGCLGVADPDVLEYPVYATANALRCFVTLRKHCDEANEIAIESMRRFLLQQQFDEARGFDPQNLAYGGWGFGGSHPPGQTGHMDLAHTRWALQALTASGAEKASYRPAAETFLRLLQKHPSEDRPQSLGGEGVSKRPPFDGGFYFSPVVLGANKGRIEGDQDAARFRSYATATCDGLLSLIAGGVPPSDPRCQAARRWLTMHPGWDYPAGIPRDHPEPWGDAVFFYHQAVRAEVYAALHIGGDWTRQLVVRLNSHVRHDGSVVNRRSSLMKEDDPILSTTLALMAATEAFDHEGWLADSHDSRL